MKHRWMKILSGLMIAAALLAGCSTGPDQNEPSGDPQFEDEIYGKVAAVEGNVLKLEIGTMDIEQDPGIQIKESEGVLCFISDGEERSVEIAEGADIFVMTGVKKKEAAVGDIGTGDILAMRVIGGNVETIIIHHSE